MNETKTPTVPAQSGFFISKIFSDSLATFKENWLQVYGLILLPVIFSFAFQAIYTKLFTGVMFGLMVVLSFIIQFLLSIGVTRSFLQIIRKQELTLADNFKTTPGEAFSIVMASIMMQLMIIAGLIIFIVPGIYLAFRYMFVPMILMDKKNSVSDAFTLSTKMTKGVKWDLLGFMFASFAVMYAGLLALFVGVFVTIPIAMLGYYFLYDYALKRVE